jgi:copper oxidase (laccase) domain-containing protein
MPKFRCAGCGRTLRGEDQVVEVGVNEHYCLDECTVIATAEYFSLREQAEQLMLSLEPA